MEECSEGHPTTERHAACPRLLSFSLVLQVFLGFRGEGGRLCSAETRGHVSGKGRAMLFLGQQLDVHSRHQCLVGHLPARDSGVHAWVLCPTRHTVSRQGVLWERRPSSGTGAGAQSLQQTLLQPLRATLGVTARPGGRIASILPGVNGSQSTWSLRWLPWVPLGPLGNGTDQDSQKKMPSPLFSFSLSAFFFLE